MCGEVLAAGVKFGVQAALKRRYLSGEFLVHIWSLGIRTQNGLRGRKTQGVELYFFL